MFDNIEIYAGKNAAEMIFDSGLKEEMISAMAGASGGPKFLVLAGLDELIFSNWFKKRKNPLFFIGSSIGAWRGAAFACKDPVKTHKKLIESYISQKYTSNPSPAEVSAESVRILNEYLTDKDIEYILSKSPVHLGIISACCTGLSAMENKAALAASFIPAVLLNIISRELLLRIFDRTLFFDRRATPPYNTVFKEKFRVPLTGTNLKEALLSSGSIPFVMDGVNGIAGAPAGTYRDGGLTDYHLNIDFGVKDGVILYPHFGSRIIPGWLDKNLKWRKHNPQILSNVLLVAPSAKFIQSLPYGKIPDRTDFRTFFNRDSERLAYWNEVIKRSRIVGEEFMEAVNGNRIKECIRPL